MTEVKKNENENSIKNNNDFSGNNYNNVVDKRIVKICENAEKEYSQSHKSKHSINNDNNNNIENGVISQNNQNINNNNNINVQKENNLNNNNNLIKEEKVNIPINREIKEDQNNALLTQSFSKIARINNKSIDTDVNILSKIKFGLQNNNNNINSNLNNNINSPFHKGSDNFNKKLALYNLDKKDTNKNRENKNKNKDKDKENKIKTDLSKILLEARDLIKKLKIKQAYILLRKTISTGIQHSDLFYLYGEVNRLVKQNKVAEEYLLKALKFELHSPYVFYSLGILYQDLKQYQNSNKFFKLFFRLLNNADLHFQMGINYFYMKDYVSAAEELSNAIDLNNECPEYYQFRSEIYKNMGLKEMENEDYNMYQYIIRKKREDNQ